MSASLLGNPEIYIHEKYLWEIQSQWLKFDDYADNARYSVYCLPMLIMVIIADNVDHCLPGWYMIIIVNLS